MKKNWLLCLILALGCVSAQAEAPRLRVMGSVGYGSGGDKLVAGQYVSGASYELTAGTGWVVALGGDLRLGNSFTIQASLGHQRNRINAGNGDIDFQRQPIELLGFYSLDENVRLGLGVRKVRNAKVTGSDAGYGVAGSGNYDSSVGKILELQYLFTPSNTERKLVTGMYLRYVDETFTLNDDVYGTGEAKNGNQIALGLVFYY